MQNQSPEPQPEQQPSRQYFMGIGIGLIPLILFLISIGGLLTSNISGLGLGAAILLYLVLLIASIVCLSIERVRFVGYGLLTMVIATPVISYIGCVVIISTKVPHG